MDWLVDGLVGQFIGGCIGLIGGLGVVWLVHWSFEWLVGEWVCLLVRC